MIEKMNFVTLTGPKYDIDRVVSKYLIQYDIHVENAMSELNGYAGLKPFVEVNPYKPFVTQSQEFLKFAGISESDDKETFSTTFEDAKDILTKLQSQIEELTQERGALEDASKRHTELISIIEHYRPLNYNIRRLLDFKFIKYRFGRISHEHYNKFAQYIMDNKNTIFYECDSDQNYIWGVYFVPAPSRRQMDAIYTSLHFERMFIPDEYNGTPENAYQEMLSNLDQVTKRIEDIDHNIRRLLNNEHDKLLLAARTFRLLNSTFDIRKKAACTRENHNIYYILCGWISASDTNTFEDDIKQDKDVLYVIEDDPSQVVTRPPTKLKNASIFRPFEMFIDMYSLPDYKEMDPTKFVALTYALMFGIMFGDVGQGALLALGGLFFFKKKNMNLGAILALCGCISVVFGFLYGSFFGYEHVSFIPTLWMKPMENIMTTLVLAVCFGVGLILIAILINMINAVRAKEYGRLLFDQNGLAGLFFYGIIIAAVLLMFTGKLKTGIGMVVGIIAIPLLVIFLKEPLTRLLEHKKPLEGSKVMFFVEAFFELFEILLSYITNSISFVRIGAFALSHAGMMEVVLMLGKATTGHPNYLIIILGNLLVMALEGLIVGIQVLRLEYYEMFSRFYKGNGRKFESYRKNIMNE